MDLNFANHKLSRAHQRIADYISKHVNEIPYLVEEDLAKACQVSISTVSRFWGEIGMRSLKDFRQHVKDDMQQSPARKLQSAFDKWSPDAGAAAGLLSGADYLQQSAERLEQAEFDRAASLLSAAGTVHIYAPGSAECLAALMDFRLTRFGVRVSRLERGGHELFDSLLAVKACDVIVIFGFVSESPEMKVLFDFAASRGCRTLLVTDLAVSPMRNKADIALYTARGQLWEFHSMIAPIAMIEALIVTIGKLREQEAMAGSEELHRLRKQYEKWLPKRV